MGFALQGSCVGRLVLMWQCGSSRDAKRWDQIEDSYDIRGTVLRRN
jgi:hypothetical protein